MSAVLETFCHIRDMQTEDVAAVMRIEEQVYAFPWTRQIFKDCVRVGYDCRVLEDHGTIVAYAVMSSGGGEAHLLNLCVHSDSQGKGLGRLLLQDVIQLARSKKIPVDTLFLEVRPSNTVALKLYEQTGFNQVGYRNNYYPAVNGREDAVVLALSLF